MDNEIKWNDLMDDIFQTFNKKTEKEILFCSEEESNKSKLEMYKKANPKLTTKFGNNWKDTEKEGNQNDGL